MVSRPTKIFQDIKRNWLDLKSGIQFLITILEEGKNPKERLDCLKFIKELTEPNERIFNLLENLIISDSDPTIREYSASFIKEKYLEKAYDPMKWAIKHETDVNTYIIIVKTFIELGTKASKERLIEVLEEIMNKKFIIGQNRYDNRKFKKSLEIRLRGKKLKTLTIKELGEILTNHKVVSNLVKKYHFVFFKWKGGLLSKLDLSELGWNPARSWEFVFEQRIEDLSEIPGLMELKHLKRLNLSNNKLTNIKGLSKLKNLTYLMLNNNQLKDPINLRYLKKLEKLQFLSLKKNRMVKLIQKEDFPDTHLVLKDYLVFQ
ncbi:MAG: leucine-rich repeat domain-containing protein [Promethearchaeota archaeon]|nr:MAG: leucine-rich repeat domain-containing protein [Candidatus Lokiarchaeota archaeon]